MSPAWLLLLWLASACPIALAEACGGAETQLSTLSRDIGRHQIPGAETLLSQLQVSHPHCASLLLAQARIKAALGASAEAKELFERYLGEEPGDAEGMAYFARFMVDQEEYQRADDLSASALERHPGGAVPLAVRGQMLDMKRQTKAGLEMLERSCAIDTDDAEAQFQLGAIYDRAKRSGDAVKHFQRVVRLDPEYASAWDYYALNLEAMGEAERADAAFKSGLTVDRSGPRFDAFLDYNYGRFLAKRNQLAESKRHLDRAVELVPQLRDTWYDRAKVNLRMSDLRGARADAEKAAAIPGRTGGILDLQMYALLEEVYRRLGETGLAQKYAALTRETPPPARKGDEQTPLP